MNHFTLGGKVMLSFFTLFVNYMGSTSLGNVRILWYSEGEDCNRPIY